MSEGGARPYYYGIDAIRFFAALIVAFFHLGCSIYLPASRGFKIAQGLEQPSFGPYLFWGHVGVPIFFVISGLVIANSANGSTAARFIQSRAERLYPAVWICATLSLLCWAIAGVSSLQKDIGFYLHSITLFPFGYWIDAPYWTLGHEVIFYGAVGMLLLMGQGHRLQGFAIAITAIGATYWGLTALAELLHVRVPGYHFMSNGAGKMLFTVYGSFFGLGILIWLSLNAKLSLFGKLFTAIALVTCIASFVLEGMIEHRNTMIELAVWLLGVIAIVFASAYGKVPDPRRRDLALLRALGLATYPLYLVHFAPGVTLLKLAQGAGLPADVAIVVVIAILTLIAILISSYAEPWIRRGVRAVFTAVYTRILDYPLLSYAKRPNMPVPATS